ncbi:hypothetical protein GCM10020367_31100 [Streptomyces sannanensis]|uniref:Peptidase inhibitor family I36 n=1 Tax=Streptomyces sannanensis TaxID=285536 RepID=A0ABP6SBW7_9ACTN
MIVKRNRPKAVVGIAAAAIALGALSAAPAQAATTCNSERLCWYQPDGNITNVDVGVLPVCGVSHPSTYPGAIGNNYVRNRNSTWNMTLYYDYDGDKIPEPSEAVVSLGYEGTATLNPNSRYYYCAWYW